nr:CBS domain-containing protein [Gemmata obscuriglobus]
MIEQLLEVGVHHLFVIDPSGIVVGIISPVDVLRKPM